MEGMSIESRIASQNPKFGRKLGEGTRKSRMESSGTDLDPDWRGSPLLDFPLNRDVV